MKTESIKALLDACYQAKRIRELLPTLPDGVSPSLIQYLDVIEHLQRRNVCVKISDISDALNIPRLCVTHTVKDMVNGALVLQAAYGAVDLPVVGRFGSTAGLSAVSTGSQVLSLPLAYCMSIQPNASLTKIGLAPRLPHGRHCAQRRVLPAFESGGAQKPARNRINREKAEVMRLRFVFWFLHPAASPPPLGARCALNSLIFRQCDPRDRRSHPPVRQGRSRWRHVRQGP